MIGNRKQKKYQKSHPFLLLLLLLLLLLFHFPHRYATQLVIMRNLSIKVWIAKRIKRTQDGRFKNRTAPLLHNFCKIHSNRCVMKFLQVIERSSMLLMSFFSSSFCSKFLAKHHGLLNLHSEHLEDSTSRFIFSICPSQVDGYHVLLEAWLDGMA
jgi:hypothetical protein